MNELYLNTAYKIGLKIPYILNLPKLEWTNIKTSSYNTVEHRIRCKINNEYILAHELIHFKRHRQDNILVYWCWDFLFKHKRLNFILTPFVMLTYFFEEMYVSLVLEYKGYSDISYVFISSLFAIFMFYLLINEFIVFMFMGFMLDVMN